MSTILLSRCYQLQLTPERPGIYDLVESFYGYDMEVKGFLETLPISEAVGYRKRSYKGHPQHPFNIMYPVIAPQASKRDYFSGFSYGYWTDLESDIQRMNPSYSFRRKNGDTLDKAPHFLEEASQDLSLQEVISLGDEENTVAPLSFEDFTRYFRRVSKARGFYTVSHRDLHHLPPHPTITTLGQQDARYLLRSRSNPTQKLLLIARKQSFSLIFYQNDTFQMSTHDHDDISTVEEAITSFFQGSDLELIENADYYLFSLSYPTTAVPVGTITLPSSFKEFRDYLRTYHHIKGRSHEELWNQGKNVLETEKPLLPHPLLFDLGKSMERTEHHLEMQESNQQTESFRMSVATRHPQRGYTNTMPASEDMEACFKHRKAALFTLPDYGELAKSSPSLSSLEAAFQTKKTTS